MGALQRHLSAFGLAVQFLTQLPVPLRSLPDGHTQSLALLYYPLVGLLLGIALWLSALLGNALPVPLLAALVLLLWCGLTGALHLDGLADSADGWMGGMGDTPRTLAIMKDPCIGAFGAVALLLQLLLKWSALTALLTMQSDSALLLAPLVARGSALLLLATTPYARPGGIASAMLAQLSQRDVYRLCAVLALALLFLQPFWLLAPALLFWILRRQMLRRLGGTTGDTAGALIELTESLMLVVGVVLSR